MDDIHHQAIDSHYCLVIFTALCSSSGCDGGGDGGGSGGGGGGSGLCSFSARSVVIAAADKGANKYIFVSKVNRNLASSRNMLFVVCL